MKFLSKKIIFIFLAGALFCSPTYAMHRRVHHIYTSYELPKNQKIIFIQKNPSDKHSIIINIDEKYFINLIPTLTNYAYSCDFNQKCEITITSPRLSSEDLTQDLIKTLSKNGIDNQSVEII